MSNFKPLVWSKYCQTELKKDLILANWSDYEFEGEVKQAGRVKIVGTVKPEVKKYTPGVDIDIERLGDNSQYLDIDQYDYFAFAVDDVDKAQSKPEYLNKEFSEAMEALADVADAYVGSLAKGANKDMISAPVDLSKAHPIDPIDDAFVRLYENNVSHNTEVAIELCPKHLVKLKREMATLFTSNVEYIKKSAVGKYNNGYIRMSNNLYNDGTHTHEMVRTKKAIAFANQIEKVKKSDMERQFGELVKGLHVYGAKIVRPEELYVMKVK